MTATTRASSAASATPSADRIMRLTAVVAAGDADLAVAECHALTGVGCMQGDAAARHGWRRCRACTTW
jgi:hypothetical protein